MTESSHPTRDTDPELLARLRGEPLIAAVAPHLSDGVWAVGGVVRDALRGAAAGPDADLVVEGDAIEEAWRVGRALGVSLADGCAALAVSSSCGKFGFGPAPIAERRKFIISIRPSGSS